MNNGDFARLPSIIGRRDPYFHTALFAGIDQLLTDRQDHEIPRLAPLAEDQNAYVRGIFKALCKHADGLTSAAIEHLDRYGTGERFDGFRRMCARAWSLFLKLPWLGEVRALSASSAEILQFWDTPKIPSDILPAISSWRDRSGVRHKLVNAEEAREFLDAVYGREAVSIFDACPHPAIKSDYFRLGWLAEHGGLYIDSDETMVERFPEVAPLLAGRLVLRFYSNQPTGHFINGLIAAPKGSRTMMRAFEEATRRIRANPNAHVLTLAGPGMLTDVLIAEADHLEEVAVVTNAFMLRNVLRGVNARYKRDPRSWHVWQAARSGAGA
ncbi:MAG: glycosyltransferase [Pseudomonadota bacterium]